MADFILKPRGALEGMKLPIKLPGMMLEEIDNPGAISIAPFNGQGMAISAALNKSVKLTQPAVGQIVRGKSARILWSGHGQWLACGELDYSVIAKALAGSAAVVDQTDASVMLCISGEEAANVMARLTPFDVSTLDKTMVAVSEFAHVSGIISRHESGFEVYISRTSSRWVVEEVVETMNRLAGQNAL